MSLRWASDAECETYTGIDRRRRRKDRRVRYTPVWGMDTARVLTDTETQTLDIDRTGSKIPHAAEPLTPPVGKETK